MKRLWIAGAGLIGSSLLHALQGEYRLIAYDISEDARQQLASLNIVGHITDDIQSVAEADIVMLATPLGAYKKLAQNFAPLLKKQAIITDAGSVKQAAIDAIWPSLSDEQRAHFVPGHPIAGTEKSGPLAGTAALFNSKKIILTPLPQTSDMAIETVTQLWEHTGASVETMAPLAHDEIYATVSHLVQLVSFAYMLSYREKIERLDSFERVFLRLAGSDAVMWRDIFFANQKPVLNALDRFITQYDIFSTDSLAEAKAKRLKLRPLPPVPGDLAYGSIITRAVPLKIAACLMALITPEMLPLATGAGLNGVSAPLLWQTTLPEASLLTKASKPFLSTLHHLRDKIVHKNATLLNDFQAARAAYKHAAEE